MIMSLTISNMILTIEVISSTSVSLLALGGDNISCLTTVMSSYLLNGVSG